MVQFDDGLEELWARGAARKLDLLHITVNHVLLLPAKLRLIMRVAAMRLST